MIDEFNTDHICSRAKEAFGLLNYTYEDGDQITSYGIESPIEQIMSVIIDSLDWAKRKIQFYEWAEANYGSVEEAPQGLYKYWQYPIGPYHADFMIRITVAELDKKLVIECDGHNYHEKTKEQAQKDKSRDRFMLSQGYIVMRFTGSEIYRDPIKIRKEINDYIMDVIHG